MTEVSARSLYEEDFYAWTQAQAAGLRQLAGQRANLPLDLENLAEEVEALGRSERVAVLGGVCTIIQRFLLWEHSAARRLGWLDEVDQLRSEIELRLSPTIRRDLEEAFGDEYARARRLVARRLSRSGEADAAAALPETCPYSLEQLLGDWMPEIGEPRR